MRTDVSTALVKKAEAISKGAEILMSKTRDWQVIKQYLNNRLGEIELTEDQQKKLKRYEYIYNQLVSGKYTDLEVINQIQKLFNIKSSQAYEDMNATREVFNTVININKRFELNLQLQINRNMLRKAEELGDMKAYAQLEKNRALLLKQLPDEEDNPAELFEGHIIEAVFDPTLLGAPPVDMKEVLKAINEKRGKKINIDMFEDIPFEEEPNNDSKETPSK